MAEQTPEPVFILYAVGFKDRPCLLSALTTLTTGSDHTEFESPGQGVRSLKAQQREATGGLQLTISISQPPWSPDVRHA